MVVVLNIVQLRVGELGAGMVAVLNEQKWWQY